MAYLSVKNPSLTSTKVDDHIRINKIGDDLFIPDLYFSVITSL
jgi:hypothetical protein